MHEQNMGGLWDPMKTPHLGTVGMEGENFFQRHRKCFQ